MNLEYIIFVFKTNKTIKQKHQTRIFINSRYIHEKLKEYTYAIKNCYIHEIHDTRNLLKHPISNL